MATRKVGKITQFTTVAAFARALGWPYQVTWRRISSGGWPLSRTPPWSEDDVRRALEWEESAELDDMTDSGAASPALERWREHRAALAELELRKARNELIESVALHDLLDHWRSSLRSACEMLQRRCGREARDILEESVNEIAAYTDEWATRQGGTSGDRSAQAGSTPRAAGAASAGEAADPAGA